MNKEQNGCSCDLRKRRHIGIGFFFYETRNKQNDKKKRFHIPTIFTKNPLSDVNRFTG